MPTMPTRIESPFKDCWSGFWESKFAYAYWLGVLSGAVAISAFLVFAQALTVVPIHHLDPRPVASRGP